MKIIVNEFGSYPSKKENRFVIRTKGLRNATPKAL